MDTRKITLIATIAAIALVAVGVGYAYTATTYNGGNNATTEYITLNQSTGNAYTFVANGVIEYDSFNVKIGNADPVTYYKLHGTTTHGNYTCVELGTTTLAATATGFEPTDALSVNVTSSGFTTTTGYVFFIWDGSSAIPIDGSGNISMTVNQSPEPNVYNSVNVTLCLGYLTTDLVSGNAITALNGYFSTNDPTNAITAGSVTFTATK